MNIMLGNLTVEQIMSRSGILFGDNDVKWLKEKWCEKTELREGTWHCYDIPFMIVCKSKKLAEEMHFRLSKYDWAGCKEALRISWEE